MEEPATTATTAETSEVWPLFLYSLLIYKVRRENTEYICLVCVVSDREKEGSGRWIGFSKGTKVNK